MSTDPDDIRYDIEQTRRELGGDVDALAEKVTPSKIMHRQTNRVREAARSARDRVFGTAEETKDRVMGVAGDAKGSVGNAISDAGQATVGKARGNPLAAGLIVFGLAWLASSLIPASRPERQAASRLKEKAEPLAQEVAGAAKQVGENLREPAAQAAEAVKASATDAVDAVKSEGASAAGEMKEHAQDATRTVRDQAQSDM